MKKITIKNLAIFTAVAIIGSTAISVVKDNVETKQRIEKVNNEKNSINLSDISDNTAKRVLEMINSGDINLNELTIYAEQLENESLKLYKEKTAQALKIGSTDDIKFKPTYFDRVDASLGITNGYYVEIADKEYNIDDYSLDLFLLDRESLINNAKGYTYNEVLVSSTEKEQKKFIKDCKNVAEDILVAESTDYEVINTPLLSSLSLNSNDELPTDTIAVKRK